MGEKELECLQGYWKAEEEVTRQSTPETHEGVPSPTCSKDPFDVCIGAALWERSREDRVGSGRVRVNEWSFRGAS